MNWFIFDNTYQVFFSVFNLMYKTILNFCFIMFCNKYNLQRVHASEFFWKHVGNIKDLLESFIMSQLNFKSLTDSLKRHVENKVINSVKYSKSDAVKIFMDIWKSIRLHYSL